MARLSLIIVVLVVLTLQLSVGYKYKSEKGSYKREKSREQTLKIKQRSAPEDWKQERGNRETYRIVNNSKKLKKVERDPIEECACDKRPSKQYTIIEELEEEEQIIDEPIHKVEKCVQKADKYSKKKNKARVERDSNSGESGQPKKQKYEIENRKQNVFKKKDIDSGRRLKSEEVTGSRKQRPTILEEDAVEQEEYSTKSKNAKTSKRRVLETVRDEEEDEEIFNENDLEYEDNEENL